MQRVALIDADILVYEAAHMAQDTIEWEPGVESRYADLEDAQGILRRQIDGILRKAKCADAILVLTDSDREANFRRTVWPTYKCHREAPTPGKDSDGRPLLYKALRHWLREEYGAKQKRGIEGDDTIGIMATMEQDFEPVICSIDKDLDTVPGWHFNWRKGTGVYYVDEEQAFWCHIYQTLTGDSTDNYPGIPGVGPVRASAYINLWSELPPWAVWEEVVGAFEDRGLTEEDALAQARCAYILHASNWDVENQAVILWTPPREEDD